jgi:hypothetical protein
VVWTVQSGDLTKTERLDLRVVGRRVRPTAAGLLDVVVAGPPSLRKKLARGLPASVRLSAADVDRTFDLTGSWSRDVRVVVVDLDEHGVGLVRDLRTVFPDVRLAGLGGDVYMRRAATRAGASATLPRSTTPKQLARTVARLLAA